MKLMSVSALSGVSCQPHDLFIELKLLQPSTDANNQHFKRPPPPTTTTTAVSTPPTRRSKTTKSTTNGNKYRGNMVMVIGGGERKSSNFMTLLATFRWIKYEQNLDLETNMWSNPYVGALVYQSLLYLKTGLQYGTVLLNSDHDSFTGIVDEMIQDFIDSGHMNKENKYLVKRTLLSNHKHDSSNTGGFMRQEIDHIGLFSPAGRRPSLVQQRATISKREQQQQCKPQELVRSV